MFAIATSGMNVERPFEEPADATPLTPDERAALRPTWIATRADINGAEAANVAAGAAWGTRQQGELLTDAFVRELHRRMFNDVWAWAGKYRLSERNIGIDPHLIVVEVRYLLDDARHWIENRTFPPDEIAVRMHHRLVFVHPFANGNGRHARLMADILAERLGSQRFTWGSADLAPTGETRRRYIAALRAADAHEIAPLLQFARS